MKEIYNKMFQKSSNLILSGDVFFDPYLLDLKADQRLGVSLLIPIQVDFSHLIDRLKFLEPNQYFYPSSDLHVTLQVIITGHSQFNIKNHPIEKYICILRSILEHTSSFEIDFHGLTMSNGAVIAQGFSTEIQGIREKIRASFKAEKVTIHERYIPLTAHMTLMRFCNPLLNASILVETINELRDTHLGTNHVTQINLNICDWYNRGEKREHLACFPLLA